MIVIGVDPHKSTHTATAVDSGTNKDLGSLRISADLNSYRELVKWAGQWPERIWAVENASGLGHHLTQWLVSQAEAVVDVPATATARVRELSRGGRRIDLVRHKGRLTNQLHALLRELLPGGLDRAFTTEEASDALRRLTPASGADAMRKEVGLAIIGDLRRLRFQIDDITTRIEVELKASGTSLLEIEGVGTITACRILSRTGDPARFRDQSAFASYAGTAPIEVASADKQRHRLSREGDRSLNAAIYIVAVTQARMAGSAGNVYYRRKLDEGKTSREAIRCLKRQIAKRLWRKMISDAGEAADGSRSVCVLVGAAGEIASLSDRAAQRSEIDLRSTTFVRD
ncbi:transposase [Tsukamurella pseudospumae]|uniref:transposase n=1 Tax=Tsukamurella pseudospumae TaxID=239498 RepID=UPI000839767D|nr:transposase [Tsukamurella pseudospumae]